MGILNPFTVRLRNLSVEFESLAHAQKAFHDFYETYNKKRILKCLLNKAPEEFLKEWENDKLTVVYHVKTKKQKFFFTEKQNMKPVLLLC